MRLLLVLSLCFSVASAVDGAVVEVQYSGFFTAVPGPLTNTFTGSTDPLGFRDTFAGVYRYETNVIPLPGAPAGFATYHAISTGKLTIDTVLLAQPIILMFSPTGGSLGPEIQIDDGPTAGTNDRIAFLNRVGEGLSELLLPPSGAGGLAQPLELTSVGFRLDDLTNSVFGDVTLPTDLDLADFSSSAIFLTFRDEFGNLHGVIGSLDSLQATVIPEPASTGFISLCVVGISLVRTRRSRSCRQVS